jgi:hypothetical protein
MDDGQVSPKGNQSRLSTHCFSYKEHEIMRDYFLEVWGITARIGKNKQIEFNKENTLKLVSLIRQHIPPNMRYKIQPAVGFSMYLSGGMEFKKSLGGPWREWITEKLKEQNIATLDPVKLEPEQDAPIPVQTRLSILKETKAPNYLNEIRDTVRSCFFRKDMYAIQLADAIIVLYDKAAQLGAGTLSEAWEAFREGRPVYLVTEFPIEQVPTWLVGETTEIFRSFEELLDYTKDHSNLIRDIKNSESTRDLILGDIY